MKSALVLVLLCVPSVICVQARSAICGVTPLRSTKGGVRSANIGAIGKFVADRKDGSTTRSFKIAADESDCHLNYLVVVRLLTPPETGHVQNRPGDYRCRSRAERRFRVRGQLRSQHTLQQRLESECDQEKYIHTELLGRLQTTFKVP